jgi:hypothetical protein
MLLAPKKIEKKGEPVVDNWIALETSRKDLMTNDLFTLGHPSIDTAPIMLRSTVAGVKARLVEKVQVGVRDTLAEMNQGNTKVLAEWTITDANTYVPIQENRVIGNPFWIEMCNPTDKEAVVSATITGRFTSKK